MQLIARELSEDELTEQFAEFADDPFGDEDETEPCCCDRAFPVYGACAKCGRRLCRAA